MSFRRKEKRPQVTSENVKRKKRYKLFLTIFDPLNFEEAVGNDWWAQAMAEEMNVIERKKLGSSPLFQVGRSRLVSSGYTK